MSNGESNLPNDQELVRDALACFQSWLCGDGLTSPGVFASEEVLAAELARLEALKTRVEAAIELVRRSDLICAALIAGQPEGKVAQALQALQAPLQPPLDDQDLKRIRAALEVYLDERGSLDLMIGVSSDRIVLSAAGEGTPATQIVLPRASDPDNRGE
jgi:hypothetical protein